MNIEEAIEKGKKYCKYPKDIVCGYPFEYYEIIKTLLTAYEKEKETVDKINKLNIPVDTLLAEFERLEDLEDDLTTVYLNGVYDGEKKVEDKIKAKIEEYDDKEMTVNLANRSAGKTFQQAVHYEVKKVLQSLLEKEQ